MAHRILIELSADDPVSMTSERVLKTLKGLSGSGIRVSGVEALDAELFVVATFLRLALGAEPLAGRLNLADALGRDESLTPAERLAVVKKLEGLLSVEPMPPTGAPAFYEGDLGVADVVTRDSDS